MRTTITIPDSLVAQVDSLVAMGNIKTRNQFIVEALVVCQLLIDGLR
jgi:metal-responsive CopG/Arc/MetJ family transcriptional regulator